MFNHMYFQISSYILEQLECIESQQKVLSTNQSKINGVQSQITVISDNIKDIRPVMDRMNQRRDDLGYIRDGLCSIIPKLSKMKETANKIMELKYVLYGLIKIENSIEKLQVIDNKEKCLQIFECTETGTLKQSLICISDKLNINCISTKLSEVRKYICNLESVISNIKNLLGYIDTTENILSVIEYLKRNINKFPNDKFIRCSLQSLSTCIRVAEVHNTVMSIYSVSNVIDYKVVNRLFESAKKMDQILKLVPWYNSCQCILGLESITDIRIDLTSINVHSIMGNLISKSKDELIKFLKIADIRKIHELGISRNHLCLCMVIKYILYPQILKLINIISFELESLSTISRKYDKYGISTSVFSDIIKMSIVSIELLEKICIFVERRYLWATSEVIMIPNLICFCRAPYDKYYHLILNSVFAISSLMENIWTMDSETMTLSIEKLSLLYSELDKMDSQNNKSICNNKVYSILVTKECKDKAGKCCCCWCLTCYNLLIMCISLCIQFKLCNGLCNEKKKKDICEKWKKCFDVKDCDCQCPKGNGLCYLLQLALSSALPCSDELEKKLEECCPSCRDGNCCCTKLKKKLKEGLCKVLLLGCECSCATQSTNEVKAWCVTFKNPWGSSSVAVVVFCKCGQAAKECCCLTDLIDKLKTKLGDNLDKICESECICKELKVEDLCCGTDCRKQCVDGCVCKKLEAEWKKICKGDSGDCLCKEFEKIKQCITKCGEGKCPCKDKDGCCKCPCCRIVAHSIKILTRAFKSNVLEPYKRITIDLMNSSKDKKQLIMSILDKINNSMEWKISLCKNYSSYGTSSNNMKVMSVRNWGSDTIYEDQVTTNSNCKIIS